MAGIDLSEEAEREATAFFEAEGLLVRPVPRSSVESPDLEIDGDAPGYLVEVKTRHDNDAVAQMVPDSSIALSQGMYWSMSIYAAARKALKQMRELDPARRRIWLIWFAAASPVLGQKRGVDQIRGTLLGTRSVIDMAAGDALVRDCFYAQKGAFEALPELDAAILDTGPGYEMWLNEFGREEMVRRSRIAQSFQAHDALSIPREYVSRGEYLSVAGGNQGRSEEQILEHLRTVHGLQRPMILAFKTHMGVAVRTAGRSGATS